MIREYIYFVDDNPNGTSGMTEEEVVRCKDCKHKVITEDGEYNPEDIVCNYWMSDGLTEKDFCSYGERSY